MKIQYLFDWRSFFTKKYKDYPPIICFPQYFYLCIYSILGFYCSQKDNERINSILRVIEYFYNDLQCIIDIIFRDEGKIHLKPPNEIKASLMNFTKEYDIKLIYLETFIRDDASLSKYQESLLRHSLEFHGLKNVNELILYLYGNNCCSTKELDSFEDSLPHSKHYVTNGTNCTLHTLTETYGFGPAVWGRFYWKLFHALPQNCTEDNVLVLDNYVKILPTLIPCDYCRQNYYLKVKPSMIPSITNKDEAIVTYNCIHNLVTKHKI